MWFSFYHFGGVNDTVPWKRLAGDGGKPRVEYLYERHGFISGE
jgi:hypothetical protein